MADVVNGKGVVADFKQEPRIRDPELLRRLHLEWRECALCRSVGFENRVWLGLSLHHIVKHPRDDVRGNLVMLCGDGVRGCHGRIEHHDPETKRLLAEYIRRERPDVLEHISWRGYTPD